MTLVPGTGGRRDRNPFDNIERAKGSLFDRVERPRDSRSLSPESDGAEGGGGRRHQRGRRGGQQTRRSDVSKPPPDNIDRYVPGQSQRSPIRRNGDGRRRGPRRDDNKGRGGDGQRSNARPRKTQEELDQEMDDYFAGNGNAGAGAADQEAVPEEPQQIAPATTAAAGDDDVDMIE